MSNATIPSNELEDDSEVTFGLEPITQSNTSISGNLQSDDKKISSGTFNKPRSVHDLSSAIRASQTISYPNDKPPGSTHTDTYSTENQMQKNSQSNILSSHKLNVTSTSNQESPQEPSIIITNDQSLTEVRPISKSKEALRKSNDGIQQSIASIRTSMNELRQNSELINDSIIKARGSVIDMLQRAHSKDSMPSSGRTTIVKQSKLSPMSVFESVTNQILQNK